MKAAATLRLASAPDWLKLDPGLTAADVAPAFRRFGRVHVPGALTNPAARRLYASLVEETPWMRIFNHGAQIYRLTVDEWDRLSQTARDQLLDGLYAEARGGFQFLYDSYNITDAVERGARLGLAVEAVHDFVNGSAFLDFVAEIADEPRARRADAQATLYRPGHFLTQHTDEQGGSDRLLAYVLNLSPDWRPDWGGLLAFMDPDQHVAEAYTPRFNALNLFRVPQSHCVTAVAPYAGGPRLSITGWIKA